MKLRPLNDRVVVEPLEEPDRVGLIYVPQTAKDRPNRGRVLAVGPGAWNKEGTARTPVDVQVGDVVLFGKYGGVAGEVSHPELAKALGVSKVVILASQDVLGVEVADAS